MKLLWSEHAIGCLRQITDFISVDNPTAAEKLADKVFALAESLCDNPKIGRIVPEKKEPSIREILYKNYRIIYRIKGSEVQILSVLEGSRLLKKDDYK